MVLIIERDDSIRRMIDVVLRRAGFRVHAVSDAEEAEQLLASERVDVVVRDVRTPRELAATPAEVLRKTIIVTTAKAFDDRTVFAVVRMPFDVQALVRVVTACARRAHEEPLAARVDLGSLQRFVSSVPSLRRVLASEQPSSSHEMLLRIEMRRAILELSDVLHEASRNERNHTRAAAFRAASMVAAELAGRPVAKPKQHAAMRAEH